MSQGGKNHGPEQLDHQLPAPLKAQERLANTIRSYLNDRKQFIVWVDQPIEQVKHQGKRGRVKGDIL